MQTAWHFTTWLDLFDHWQTLWAAGLAVLAALGTIYATVHSANRQIAAAREQAYKEIAASREQTAAAQKQIETTLRLERRRAAREGYAFHATIWAAMERVLLEAAEAKSIFLKAGASEDAKASREAYEARQHFSKGAFPELRTACVRYGGRVTRDLLELERDIDVFASQKQGRPPSPYAQLGLHADFLQQIEAIEAKATYLHGEAVAGMERANKVIEETDAEGASPGEAGDPKHGQLPSAGARARPAER